MKNKRSIGLLIVFFLSFWLIKPLFNGGLFPIHDDTQVARVIEMKKALLDGNFPVRLSPDLGYGYGYPLFNFYAPLPYYFGGLVDLLLNNPIVSTKIMYGLGIILSGISMYLLIYEIGGLFPSLVAASCYAYAPYHAIEIYIRGSVGEYWAYGLLPFLILGFYKLFRTKKTSALVFSAFMLALFVLSHNIISMLFMVIFALIFFISFFVNLLLKRSWRPYRLLAAAVLLGLSLSAFFWLPAIAESRFTSVSTIVGGGSDYHDHFVFLDQLWDSPWGFAGSAPGREDGLSFKLGKINLILALTGLISLVILKIQRKIKKEVFLLSLVLLSVLFLSFFLVLPSSVAVWNFFSFFLKYVQFPWRFLVFIVFGLSFLSSFFILLIQKKFLRAGVAFALIILLVVVNDKYFQPQTYLSLSNSDYLSSDYLKWTVSKISDEYLPLNFNKPFDKDLLTGNMIDRQDSLRLIEQKTNLIRLTGSGTEEQEIILNQAYFPGWTLYLDGKTAPIGETEGLISFTVPEGQHNIVLVFKDTPVRIIADCLSFIGLLVVSLWFIRKKKGVLLSG